MNFRNKKIVYITGNPTHKVPDKTASKRYPICSQGVNLTPFTMLGVKMTLYFLTSQELFLTLFGVNLTPFSMLGVKMTLCL